MEASAQRPSLVAIVGPTASGKSDLAIKIAQKFNGEIIAADSRTIYKGMDIGTAKPTAEEQNLAPHWGLDLVEPGEPFSAHQFKIYAEDKIKDIQNRGKLPILVGGTGLYIDSVLFDFQFVDSESSQNREELEKMSTDSLQSLIKKKGYKMPENYQNRRHLIRTIERKGKIGEKSELENILLVGLMPDAELLKKRINKRAESYFAQGLLQETEQLLDKYGVQPLQTIQGIAYIAALKLLQQEINQQEALEQIKKQEWQYARRQRTWFKRNNFINWFESPEEAFASVRETLNN